MGDPIVNYQLRVILIGDTTVGKTCMLRYFTDGHSPDDAKIYDPTVGVDFFSRFVTLEDQTRLKLQIWDTAGQERFRSITQSYYRNSVGVVLVFDLCQRTSFEHIPTWMMEARRSIEPRAPTFVLVGSKADQETRREVMTDEAQRFADLYDMPYVECSAVSGHNVSLVFEVLAARVRDRIVAGQYDPDDSWEGVRRGYSAADQAPLREPPAARRRACC
ncbi:ras-related protein Rab-39B-like [Amphibalanus amphitrite]|nr:ras-related protein Rab-39B-like [Amphibalanus amphitrite]XP_043245816.1 ras-related protein Rab-39B-like [Amphibalanus amphitrite]XP_043245818.1 ras-related protein Rab-39B-like [Amphibalanus amphitrite]XP_043245819.1 ras-related protein Rab-39B-like [Amphibalanus amphitrite]